MALLGKLNLTESSEMEFGLEVFGTTERTSHIRFVIEGPEFDISCHCKEENGNITTSIPKLKGILPAGIYETRLDVVLDGKIFTPLRESIEFNPLVEFDIKQKKVEAVKEGVKISVKKPMIAEESRETLSGLEQNIQKAIKSGYEVSKIGEHYVMKKGDLYAGLISEKTIIKSKKLYESLTELIDGLSK